MKAYLSYFPGCSYILIALACVASDFSSVDAEQGSSKDENVWSSSSSRTSIIVLSLVATCLSCTTVVILCSQCWQMIRIRRGDRQLTDDEANAGDSGVLPRRGSEMVQMNVRELELDPIVFEPLPTLTNIESYGDRKQMGRRKEGRNNMNYFPELSYDSTVYAHDWFDEPFTNFPRGNLEYIKEIGTGWFGKVIEAFAKDIVPFARRIRVIVKVLRDDATGLEQMRFLDEARMYRDSTHGNILRLLGHSIETSPFLLILEECPQGNLKSFLISNVHRADLLNKRGDVLRMGIDLANALSWMSSADFVHGDLAARNCLVSAEGRVIIGDYGLSTSTFKDDYYWSSNGVVIPLRWAAPETIHCTMNTIQTLKVTKSANAWSFGVLLWEIATFCKQPYYELDDDEVIIRVICDKNYVLGAPSMTNMKGQQLYDMMKKCWNPEPNKRPPVSTLLAELETLYREVQAMISSVENFDSKWELFHPNTSQTSSQRVLQHNKGLLPPPGKKSVRFAEADAGNAPNDSFQTRGPGDSFVTSTGRPAGSHKKDSIVLGDLQAFNEISEKVTEKSQKYQDFMILTHVDASELEDSLPFEDSTSVNNERFNSCSSELGSSLDDSHGSAASSELLSTSAADNMQDKDKMAICSETTTPISPLKEESKLVKSSAPGTATSNNCSGDSAVVLFGPSDELGLNCYQQFTTEVLDPSFSKQINEVTSPTSNSAVTSLQMLDTSNDQRFWMTQMKSLKEATSDALEMFQEGLREVGENKLNEHNKENGSECSDTVRMDSEKSQLTTDQANEETSSSYLTLYANSTVDTSEVGSPFVPSTWNQSLVPQKPALKSPDSHEKRELNIKSVPFVSNLKKSVSFESNKIHLYEYTPPPPASDSEEEDRSRRFVPLNNPAISLDWDLQPDDLDTKTSPEFSNDGITYSPRERSAVDFYHIAGFEHLNQDLSSHSTETPAKLKQECDQNVVLGELRHKRDKLKLDLGGESHGVTGDAKSTNQRDSGMGSSTSASPFK